jgi:serpin B
MIMVVNGKVLLCSLLLVLISIPPAFPDEKAVEQRVDGDTAFMLDLYAKMIDDPELEKAGGNLFFSPHSLSMALAMTWAGAKEDTAGQMARVLHLSRPPEAEHEAFGMLRQDLASANALWVQKGTPFLPEYLEVVRRYYDGCASEVDFKNAAEAARKTINAWVDEKTAGKIEELLKKENMSSLFEMVITNAVYMKEEWASLFTPENTVQRPFQVSAGETVQVPMMYQMLSVEHLLTDDLQIIRLPFAGNKTSMVLLVPRNSLAELEKNLSADNLEKWLGSLQEDKVGIFIPRFKMTSRFALKECLKALGMTDAFSGKKADFSGMTGDRGLYIDEVIHQAGIEIDENGAEAAAGSAVPMKKGGWAFFASRPFLFFIQDNGTGSMLFMGRLVNPSKL